MKIDLSQFKQTFMQESAEHLASMEANLLELREAPDDIELLNAIFRSAHSIKGGAGSFGLTNVVRFTHTLENLLDRLRSMEIPAVETVIALLLRSADALQGLLQLGTDGDMPATAVSLLKELEKLTSSESAAAEKAPAAVVVVPESSSKRYTVEFLPSKEMLQSGTNPIVLLRNLLSLGTATKCTMNAAALPSIEELDPAVLYLNWTVEMTSEHTEAEIREEFEFVEHLAEIRVSCAAPAVEAPVVANAVEKPAQAAAPAAEVQAPVKQDTPAAPAATGRRKQDSGGDASSIRVSTDKVDRLIDLVGELVIAHVMTKQLTEGFTAESLPKLCEAVAAMERNIRELHERVMGVRMIPVGTLFQRFKRTVFDIAQSTGKNITLETLGEETEIDKSLLELLGDSLIHLVRNSADHGIESPEERKKAGKPVEGVIRLKACHRSGKMAIEITDDGAGIDPVRVRAKAVERGLITAESKMTDEQIQMLIFEPGFSTRSEVSDLSGRGVGMDVVKRNVQKLSGVVTLTSQKGVGSTVNIELPLTLAIMEGLLVRVEDRVLVLPLLSVVEAVCPSPGQIVRVAEQGEVVNIRKESVPLLRISRFLGLDQYPDRHAAAKDSEAAEGEAAVPSNQVVIVVETGAKKIGLVVDEIAGQQQVVLKSLDAHFHKVDGLMGVTILGDGCVAPVIDVSGIASLNLFSLKSSHPASMSGTVYDAVGSRSNQSGGVRHAVVQ